MCLSPILIKNSNYGRSDRFARFVDTSNAFIKVPCGVCANCLQVRQYQIIQRIEVASQKYFAYFCTLTYNNEHLPTIDIGEYTYHYCDITHLQKCLKRLRHKIHPFKYLFVTEYGSKKHRPHYHGLIFIEKKIFENNPLFAKSYEYELFNSLLDCWSVNLGTDKKPRYNSLLTYKRKADGTRNYDLHFVNNNSFTNSQECFFYVTKYALKYDPWIQGVKSALYMNYPPDEFYSYWKLLRPRMLISKGLGTSFDCYKDKLTFIDGNPMFCHSSGFKTYLNPIVKRKMPVDVALSADTKLKSRKDLNFVDSDRSSAIISDPHPSPFCQVFEDNERVKRFGNLSLTTTASRIP